MRTHTEYMHGGFIKANTECPYKTRCGDYKEGLCLRDKYIDESYSCGYARLFRIFDRSLSDPPMEDSK